MCYSHFHHSMSTSPFSSSRAVCFIYLIWWQNFFKKTVYSAAAAAKSLQSCPTLCDPMDCSPPGFSAHGIFQARVLEWGAITFSNAWKWKVKVKSLSRVGLFATPWTAAYQAPPSMGFSRQEYWSGMPLPSPVYAARSILILKRQIPGSLELYHAIDCWCRSQIC